MSGSKRLFEEACEQGGVSDIPVAKKKTAGIRVVKLYSGEVEIAFKAEKHTYRVTDPANGIVDSLVPSVTQILRTLDKPALVGWAAKCGGTYIASRFVAGETYTFTQEEIDALVAATISAHRNVSKAACDIGKDAHAWIADSLTLGQIPDLPKNPAVASCCTAARRWIDGVGLRPTAVEEIVYSRKHSYLGTMDTVSVVEIEGHPAIVDWKSSKGIYAEYRFQLAAYKNAYEEMTGVSGLERYVVKLGKEDGSFEPVRLPRADYEADLAAFLGLIPAAKRMKELERAAGKW
jgi:hypothetical protein